jgi:uncharacterized protein CbrC (UPF0167 family)
MTNIFRYVPDSLLPEIFASSAGKKCDICDKTNDLTLIHWHWPDHFNVCPGCIANGYAMQRNMCFRSPGAFRDSNLPFNQLFELIYCTPPTTTFCESQEPYRWAYHCGDFALYIGDVPVEEIPKELLVEQATNEGVDTDNIAYSCQQGESCFHRFECLKCKEQILTFDYFF